MSKVSVIIPTFNRSHLIGKTIDSVLNQTYRNFEIIVIDDGSTDNTREVVRSYGDVVRYFKQTNSGVAAARNTGIAMSEGEYISFLDSDDTFLPDNLEIKMAFFKNHTNESWVYSDWQYVDERGDLLQTGSQKYNYANRQLNGIIFNELIYHRNFISPCTVVLKKLIFKDIGYFDASILSLEEYDLWIRISLKYPVNYINEVLTYTTIHSGSLSEDFSKWVQGNARIIDKLDGILPETFDNKKKFLNRMHADKFTFLGRDFSIKKNYRKAMGAYWNSIKRLPFQKKIYWLLCRALVFYSISYLCGNLRCQNTQ